jgi:hypothetical protein
VAKARQASATLDELRGAYRTPRAAELAEDAGMIAEVLFRQCGWVQR